MQFLFRVIAAAVIFALLPPGSQSQGTDEPLTATIEVEPDQTRDAKILKRAQGIFSQIEALNGVAVTVVEGVITLGGEVANEADAETAIQLARRIEGAVTVQDSINRTLDVSDNIAPLMTQIQDFGQQALRAAPLIAVALVLFLLIAWLGHKFAQWRGFWQKVTPNPFLAELVSQAFRLVVIIVALVTALNLIGASSLTAAILGSAGILGIAIGFAVRDTLENYISSVMLSLRQPFRANERVVIGNHEGVVVRLTSRATILMTLDGNHLRIPNSDVFKATILNYTRNPERRFEFELGVDAEDDPLAAISVGINAMKTLDFILSDPKPFAIVKTVGDSNIVLSFYGWINQSVTDFGKARSLAIRAAKDAIEQEGFTLPEPIYRLRFDGRTPLPLPSDGLSITSSNADEAPTDSPEPRPKIDAVHMDTAPDNHLEEKAAEERAETKEADLLDEDQPVE